MILFTFLSKFVMENFPQHILPLASLSNAFVQYTSPTIVLVAIALLIICSKQTFGTLGIKMIGIVAPASLGVYLIHVNMFVWEHVLADMFVSYVNFNCIFMVLLILLSALGIYAVCTVIELIRIRLFKLAKVDKLCCASEAWLVNLLDHYCKL